MDTGNKQSGRSMIEMLGVLAIIGVLSAGGIAGYSTAMESHKVNKFMEMASYSGSMIETELPELQSAQILYIEDLCSLNIIYPDICNAVVSEWGEDYRKGWFGEKLYLYLYDYSATASPAGESITYADGTTGKYYSPLRFFGIRIMSPIPQTACIKIVSNKGWLQIGALAATSITDKFGSLGATELPLSIEQAEIGCKAEVAGGVDFRINIFTHLHGLE